MTQQYIQEIPNVDTAGTPLPLDPTPVSKVPITDDQTLAGAVSAVTEEGVVMWIGGSGEFDVRYSPA